jgi:hypothetical protein
VRFAPLFEPVVQPVSWPAGQSFQAAPAIGASVAGFSVGLVQCTVNFGDVRQPSPPSTASCSGTPGGVLSISTLRLARATLPARSTASIVSA